MSAALKKVKPFFMAFHALMSYLDLLDLLYAERESQEAPLRGGSWDEDLSEVTGGRASSFLHGAGFR